jgi:hypothetical protein
VIQGAALASSRAMTRAVAIVAPSCRSRRVLPWS